MARRITPYAYRPGHSPLHRIPAAVKLLAMFAISFSAFMGGFPALAAASVIIIAGAIIAKIAPWELMAGSKGLLIMASLVIVVRSISFDDGIGFSREGFFSGLIFAWGMAVSFSSAALLFATSTQGELRDSLTWIEKILLYPLCLLLRPIKTNWSRGMQKALMQPRIALGIALMLGYIPRFFEIWENTCLAYRARSGKKGFREITTVLPIVCGRMIEAASDTAEAMESRGV